ncbi:mitogen-activated protein kinase kinase kinase YODA [Pyrus ussuriensis x Pyrus communis]|uniref:mitogen-activated protein kinase kinase kinase n=1 Tax=Pyrus ussuriensis x Pyrus communis TaxID=2448454 RepID=A0A5N5H4P0_9ROSA|nr:mitogen-activated protein kinase kinase kinase YODA [Pyrus ussuriensis x Pyrus communis]
MPSWWRKSSSKEVKKKKGNRESFIDTIATIHRKLKSSSEEKCNGRSGGSRRRCIDTVSEMGSLSRVLSPVPSSQVSRCPSFAEKPHAQPLPLPRVQLSNIERTNSGISSNQLFYLPLPGPGCVSSREDHTYAEGDLATASISSDSSIDSDDPSDSRLLSPMGSDYENGNRTNINSPSCVIQKDPFPTVYQKNSKDTLKAGHLLCNNQVLSTSPKWKPSSTHMQNIQIPFHGTLSSAPDSSMSSPSRSPMRVFSVEQVRNSSFWAAKTYPDIASTHCSSPGSGQNSGHNSVGGDMSGQLFWQHIRCSPECSPIPSPRMTSPGPNSRIQSGAATPLHPRSGGPAAELPTSRPDDVKQKSHRLPLPPITITKTCPFSPSYSATTTPTVPRSPNRVEHPTSPGSQWKKGRLLGRGTFGHVYLGFNSESGEMCAMKEVTLFADDAKSKESAQQLGQEIALLSRLRHPNIVQYYGSETVDDKLYIYLEYVSGGSIYKLLQEYGQFGEVATRSYTQQILSGLAYLHTKNTVHRDIKGANILVDPNGRVKLADFGMAKHITGQSCPLSFNGSPYWMAPEVIKNSNGCNLAVDIWSLGCTVLEMATTKPPWSQYEGVAAMFKIGNSKELPEIPDHLSEDGKSFIRLCLQRNPLHRPTAAQLLEHPFVRNVAPLERTISSAEHSKGPAAMRSQAFGHGKNHLKLDSEGMGMHQSRGSKTVSASSDAYSPKNVSCPISPIGSPLLHSRSPQHVSGRMSPSPISSPHTTSGSSTPLTSSSIPFQHLKQPTTYSLAGIGMTQRSQNCGFHTNGNMPYHEPKPDLSQGFPQGSYVFRDIFFPDNGVLGNQVGHSVPGDPRKLFDVQSVLADCVSQQLLRDHIKLNIHGL